MTNPLIPTDPWSHLGNLTQARIGLGRAGPALPTREVLAFGLAHAQARDAVHQALDADALAHQLQATGLDILQVNSRAPDRRTYLQRPDLGRRLASDSAAPLALHQGEADLAIVIADGLSALATTRQTAPLLQCLLPLLSGLSIAPLVIASQSRVALADEVGELLGSRAVLILLGERPGLSSPDSLGAYLTYAPKVGCLDAARNCVSNIRPEGLPPAAAAHKLAWLIRAALRLQLTGVGLKDESDVVVLGAEAPAVQLA
ncbi:ethanolamine ammonia-lyase subunit EutC [Chitinimonas naiadis]